MLFSWLSAFDVLAPRDSGQKRPHYTYILGKPDLFEQVSFPFRRIRVPAEVYSLILSSCHIHPVCAVSPITPAGQSSLLAR